MLDKQLLLNELKLSQERYEEQKVIEFLGKDRCKGAKELLKVLIQMIEDGVYDLRKEEE